MLCWGDNTCGQLGDGTDGDKTTATEVVDVTNTEDVAVGGMHTCARTIGGEVWCWGRNSTGQVGDGTREDRFVPATVVGL